MYLELLLFPKKDWLGKNAGGSRGGEKVSSGEIVEGNGGKRIIRCEEFPETVGHKVLIYRAPQCMSPRWNWDSPTPLAAGECAPPTFQRLVAEK